MFVVQAKHTYPLQLLLLLLICEVRLQHDVERLCTICILVTYRYFSNSAVTRAPNATSSVSSIERRRPGRVALLRTACAATACRAAADKSTAADAACAAAAPGTAATANTVGVADADAAAAAVAAAQTVVLDAVAAASVVVLVTTSPDASDASDAEVTGSTLGVVVDTLVPVVAKAPTVTSPPGASATTGVGVPSAALHAV